MATELGLPDHDENLFQRIIRNPHVDAQNPRERECTEMLCSVLLNSTVLRNYLLTWMASISDTRIERINDLSFEIGTEGSIGSKRDDLRIEGWRESDENRQRVFLWTVEVKVGASFHESSPLDGVSVDDTEFVNQVVNYDHWLEKQTVPHRAGFVLALENLTSKLPANLNCNWHCFSWTALGLKLRDALQNEPLSHKDSFLAEHMLGFISNHLWRVSEMDEPDLNFDDVAIIRAFLAVGRDCEEKVNRLVETLSSLIKEHEVGDGSITHTKSLFKAFERSVVYRNLFASSLSMYPTLMAGIDGTDMAIWLDTAPGNANKTKIKAVLESLLPNLQTRNPDWRVLDKGWPDIELRKPLITLLDAQNQPAQFVEFFEGALNDLKETHVVEMLSQALSDG